jgi:hypothetical protein
MFLDIVKSMTLYNIKQREETNGVYLSTLEDYERAKGIYAGMAETNTTNLSEIELKTMQVIADTGKGCLETKDIPSIAKKIGRGETSVKNYLNGIRGNEGLFKKIPGLTCKDERITKYNGGGGDSRAYTRKIYSYTGVEFKRGVTGEDFMPITVIDESHIDACNLKTLEALSGGMNHMNQQEITKGVIR